MCVLLDVRFRTYSGPANAIINMVPKLFKLSENSYTLLCYKHQNKYFPDSKFNKIIAPDNVLLDIFWTQIVLPILILKKDYRLYISFKFPVGPILSKIRTIFFARSIFGSFRGDIYPVSLKVKFFWVFIGIICFRRAYKLIAVSQFIKEYLSEKLKISEEKIVVIHDGVDIDYYPSDDGDDDVKLLKMGIRKPFLFCCGNVLPVKNHETAIEMMNHLPRELDHYQLVIAGDYSSPHAVCLRSQVNLSSLKEKIVFTGFLDCERLAVLYRQASVFVLPSLTEAFSNVILEALAFGLPIVASDRGSLKEACGDCALYVKDPKDSIGFARCVEKALNISQDLASAEKAIQRSSDFNWDNIARQCHELFLLSNDKYSEAGSK